MVGLLQVFGIAVATYHTEASIIDNVVEENYKFNQSTLQGATEKLVGKPDPIISDESPAVQQDISSGGYFAPFGIEGLSKELFVHNDSLKDIVPILNVAKKALNQAIPTNDWWCNLIHVTDTLNVSNHPAWANPYAVKLPREAPYGLQIFYSYTHRVFEPPKNGTFKRYNHTYHNDLTLSSEEFFYDEPVYEVYEWDEGGAKLRTCDVTSGKCMDSALVSGMAFVSAKYSGLTPRIDTEHNITYVDDSVPGKFIIYLNNTQTWVLYASDNSLSLRVERSVMFSVNATGSSLVAGKGYTGTIRLALLPENCTDNTMYDEYAGCMVLGGTVSMESRTQYSLNWQVEGSTCQTVGLLHFALQHQLESLTGTVIQTTTPGAIILNSATRGRMVGQVTTNPQWMFHEPEANFDIDFYPVRRPSPWLVVETDMLRTLQRDIMGNWTGFDVDTWYFNGKSIQKYASLCLMASDPAVVGTDKLLLSFCLKKLEKLFEPILNNTLSPPLMYDTLYRGLISSSIFRTNSIYQEFGNGIYNDHHYHYGYFVVAAAMFKHLDPKWSRMPELEAMIWTMMRDVVNPSKEDKYFPRFRHFSWYLAHSYSHGVTSINNGKDEESTSEDINFYYGMTMWGKVTGKSAVEDLGSLMLRLNAHAICTYFLLKLDNVVHPPEIVRNHVTGIFFDNQVYYNTWFLDEVYAIHGIQMIPVSPVNELARTSTFVEQEWNNIVSKLPIITEEGSNITWLSLLLVNGATVNPMESLRRLPNSTMDDGLSLSWALYNAATRCRDDVGVNLSINIRLTIDVSAVMTEVLTK
ncbi:putative endo-1,3(4)-beta-glucanase, glycosyl hydrolase family 81 [Plasmopara halstedii]